MTERKVISHSVVSDFCHLMALFVCGIFQVRVLQWVAISYSRRDLPDPKILPHIPHIHCRWILYHCKMEALTKNSLSSFQWSWNSVYLRVVLRIKYQNTWKLFRIHIDMKQVFAITTKWSWRKNKNIYPNIKFWLE